VTRSLDDAFVMKVGDGFGYPRSIFTTSIVGCNAPRARWAAIASVLGPACCASGEMGDELSEDMGDGCFQKGGISKDMVTVLEVVALSRQQVELD
jgi:hypothetical protein